MPIKLADLVVKLGADSTELNTELDKSAKAGKKWQKGMNKAGTSVSKTLRNVSIAAGVATTGLTAMYSVNARNLDVLGKTASRLGVTASELDRFGKAAEFSGVEATAAFGAIQEMTKRLGEAANGSGEAAKALDKIGLSINDLRNLNPAQIFDLILDKTDELNQQDKLFVFDKLFGGSGVGLANVTREARDRANELNATLDKLFGTLNTSAVEAANDDFSQLQSISDRAAQTFTADLAPSISAVSRALFTVATANNNVGDSVSTVTSVARLAIKTTTFLVDGVRIAIKAIQLLVTEAMGAVFGFMSGSATALAKLVDFIPGLPKDWKESTAQMERDALAFFEGAQLQSEELRASIAGILSGEGSLSAQFERELAEIDEQIAARKAAAEFVKQGAIGGLDETNGATSSDDDPDNEPEKTTTEKLIEQWTLQEQAAAAHIDAMAQILTSGAETTGISRLKAFTKLFGQELSFFGQHSRKVFEISKALNIANVVQDTAAGIARALTLPFPKSLLVGAKYALIGAKQLRTIHETKMGGSGKTPTVGASTSGGVSDSTPSVGANDITSTGTDPQLNRNTQIIILKDRFNGISDDELVATSVKNLNEQGIISVTDGELDTRNVVEVAV